MQERQNKTLRATIRIATVLALILAAGCGGGGSSTVGGSAGGGDTGGGTGGDTGGGDTGGGTGGDPPPPVFGLDVRASNADCVAPARPSDNAAVQVEDPFPAAPQFTAPTKLLQPPGDGSRWFVLEQAGRIRVLDVANPAAAHTYVDLSSRVVSGGELGLLGLAFPPDFPSTPEIYVFYTANAGGQLVSRLSRLTLDNAVSPVNFTEQVILAINQPSQIHKGGDLDFGADGHLYVSTGDGGQADNGQDNTDLLGAMLRIDVLDVAWPNPGYRIPSDNPFAPDPKCGPAGNAADCPEIYAWGLRNPWRWSFDRPTGDLWLGTVGEGFVEQVELIRRGGNYGWPCTEGIYGFMGTECPQGTVIEPRTFDYPHGSGASVTGGYVYRGNGIPALYGRYVFGDFVRQSFYALLSDGHGGYTSEVLLGPTRYAPTSFALGHDGELYFTDYASNRVYRLRQAGGADSNGVPSTLSASGCFDASDPKQPSPGLLPYDVNASFWSDGAAKSRWLAIPDGTTVHVDSGGDMVLPPGSILAKSFRLSGRLIETRLLMRHTDGSWAGYTYAWNDAQTDAARVIGGRTRDVGGQTWIYPSETQCMQCHTAVTGFSLGLTTAQLNRDSAYPSTGRTANQLATLEHIGMFDAPLSAAPADLPRLADPTDTSAPLPDRARAYLDANCSQCHRPGGTTPSTMDWRYATPLGATNACDVPPQLGDLDILDARLIAPGAATRSVIPERLGLRDIHGMPPVGSAIPDAAGHSLVSQWADSLTGCD
jgi:uncharacterized repeat protein (TIGR03806 family)